MTQLILAISLWEIHRRSIRKDSVTHLHGLGVYLKEEFPFTRVLFLGNSVDSHLLFRLVLIHSVSYFFPFYWSPSSLCTVFHAISSNIDALSINPSSNALVFGNFYVDHKDWLTYSGGNGRPRELELCYNLKWPYSDG